MVAQGLVSEKQHRMVAPSLHDARERDILQVLKIHVLYRGAQRCAGRNYGGWAAADTARHFGFSAQSHRKPPLHRAGLSEPAHAHFGANAHVRFAKPILVSSLHDSREKASSIDTTVR